MELYIDTSDRYIIKVGVGEKIYEADAKEGSSQKLLVFIDETLKKEGVLLNQIKKIKVATGPGSFTGLRVGVTVANTLGWALDIPVNGKNIQKGETIEIVYQ